jgi:multisubunit Na+/H+ antiporter MnhF subunit
MSVLQVIAFVLIGASVLLALLRLFLGPTTPDRVVAADTLAVITTASLVWMAGYLGNEIYLDIALVYGALAFVAVVTVARVLESIRR